MMLGRVDYAALRLDEMMKIHASTKLQVGKHDEPGPLVIEMARVGCAGNTHSRAINASTVDLSILPSSRKRQGAFSPIDEGH